MPKESRFIISINPAGWLTLAGLAVDLAALLLLADLPPLTAGQAFAPAAAGESRFFLAIALMYLGMAADAFDGMVARRFHWDSEFGRYLDGFVDVFNYLVLPNLALWRLGFRGPWAALIIIAMVACGVLRLAKFNMIGNIKDKGEAKYLGMPVFWAQLIFFPLYLVSVYLPGIFFPACAAAWTLMSIAFIYNRAFYKPKNPFAIAGLTLALGGSSLLLYLRGYHP